MKYDVIIVGAGPAGTMTAINTAKSGLSTLLIDKEPKDKVGDKVCGNAVSLQHLKEIGLNPPSETTYGTIDSIEIISPDLKNKYRFSAENAGIEIDRLKFGQYLLKLALDNGANFIESVAITSPIIENNMVVGVSGVNLKDSSKVEFKGSVVVDASGAAGVLRKKLHDYVDDTLDDDETMVAFREIRTTRNQDKIFKIFINQQFSPGGYFWYVPMGENLANIGIGVRKNSIDPKFGYREFLKFLPNLKDSKVVHSGSGIVPVRRPMAPAVWNGILFIGDSGFTVDPITGGGIGSSLEAGKIAAESIVKAHERGSFLQDSLWDFSLRYNKKIGHKYASLDVMRIALQARTNEEINFIMRSGIVSQDDLLKVTSGEELKLNFIDAFVRAIAGMRHFSLLLLLLRLVKLSNEAKTLYYNFPTFSEFKAWKEKDLRLHKAAHSQLA
ncbi:MAG: NAD(P)/FAD-dependent oxidoreductase [Candidatus Brockarchaeota archaeon]|nr:NAD(P)/FAD-dependent oxidoreductase [Candidatus Brockarchaeota archaeon]MBO3768611.1 NAD(P)/FAD-dependent oxidoreductase [Candidatus Brockarchaeota archaeon]